MDMVLTRIGITSKRQRAIAYGGLSLTLLLILWLCATTFFGWIEARVLPSPGTVVAKFAEFTREPFSGLTLIGHIGASLN